MGFYAGFEPPSCLSVMRCLKHAILPKTYVQREFAGIKNRWECYGVPELVVVDNPAEFHSSHFERACLTDRRRHSIREGSRALVQGQAGKISRHDVPRPDARESRELLSATSWSVTTTIRACMPSFC